MAFDLESATVSDEPTTGGFDIGSAEVLSSSGMQQETMYREETGEMIDAPSDLDGSEVEYLDDIKNRGEPPEGFLGYAKIGIDHVVEVGKGLTNFFSTVPAKFEGSVRMQHGDAYAETLSRPFKASDILSFIPNPFSSRDEMIGAATWDRMLLSRPEEIEKIQSATALSKSGAELIRANEAWVEKYGFKRPEEESMSVAFDIGQVGGSIGASIGLSLLTKSPAMAAVFFGGMQKNDAYVEAKEKGFSGDAADKISSVMGVLEGGLEFIGVGYFLKAAGAHKGLKLIGARLLEEALQEGSQQTAEEVVSQTSGLRELDVEGGVGRVIYSMMVGAIGGGAVASIIEVGNKSSKEEKVPSDIVPKLAEKIVESSSEIESSIAEILDQEASPLRQNDQASAQVAKIMQDFAEGRPVDISKMTDQDKKIITDSMGSEVEQQLAALDKQQGRNLFPVPKRPETLSKFLKSKGGLSISEGEARRYTRKETPTLGGVASKNGKLTMDQALELAIEEGFIKDTAFEDGTRQSTINDLIDALEAESSGRDIVRSKDQSFADARNEIISLNDQQRIENDKFTQDTRGIRGIREAFRTGVTAAKKDVKSAQSAVIDALEKSGLSLGDRAKFTRQIKNIQTIDQLQKAAPDIEERIQGLLDAESKRDIRSRIKKIISSAKKSENMAVDTVEEIKELERRLKNEGILPGADRNDADLDGRDPPTINDLTVGEFENALAATATLSLKGKARLMLQKELKAQRTSLRLSELAADSVPISNVDLQKAGIGERLGVIDKMKNVFTEGANKVQRLGLNKNPMDVIFDIMDGFKNYQGANSRVFKKTIDRGFSKYLQLKEETTRAVKVMSDKFKFDERNLERIGAWAALQQEGGYRKLIASGVTEAELKAIEARYKNGGINEEAKNEIQMYNLMREKLDSLRPALREVMRSAYNKDFKNVKDYFPFMTDFKAMTGTEIQEMFGEDAFEIGATQKDFNRKDVKKGFTKERKGGDQKIRIDAMGVFLNHVDNATYLIEMGQNIKELGDLALTPDFGKIAGDFGQEVVIDWINLLARKGNVGGNIDLLDQFRVNTGAAALAFKVSSALIQPTALMDGAAMIGGDYVSQGVFNTTQKEWREFMHKNMPELRERVGDDPAYMDMGGGGAIGAAREAGFWALKRLDLLAASAVASGAYVKSVESRGGKVDLSNPDPIAIEDAQLAMRRTQSSSFAKDMPPIISQAKLTGNISLDKLLLQFQSFMLNRWSLIEHDMFNAGIKKGRTVQAMNVATWLVLANISEYSIRQWTKEMINAMTGYEPPEDDDTLLDKTIRQAISNVPFVSSFVSAAQYGSIPVPSLSIAQSIFNSLSYADKSKSPEKKMKHYTQAGIVALGSTLGVPGTLQAKQLSRGLFDDDKKSSSDKKDVLNP